jgi:PAS domain S-box-containing protein
MFCYQLKMCNENFSLLLSLFTLCLDTTAWEYSYDQIRRQGSRSQTTKRAVFFFLTFLALADGDLASQTNAYGSGSPSLGPSGLVASAPPRRDHPSPFSLVATMLSGEPGRSRSSVLRSNLPCLGGDCVTPSWHSKKRGVCMAEKIRSGSVLLDEADQLLLERYTPASVVIDADGQILQVRGHTSPYLELAPGKSSIALLPMVRDDLRASLAATFAQARLQGTAVTHEDSFVTLEVLPLRGPSDSRAASFLVLFHETLTLSCRVGAEGSQTSHASTGEPATGYIAALQEEPATTRAAMQMVLEERDAANEELQSANEEIRASLEELRVSNEELTETNQELSTRNAQLKAAQEYADAMIETMSQPLVVLSADLRVLRGNQAFFLCFQVTPEEVLGHLLSEIGSGQWQMPLLLTRLAEVLATNEPLQQVEGAYLFSTGKHKTLLLSAHRIPWQGASGPLLLLAMEDITERAEAERIYREAVQHIQLQADLIESAHDAIVVRDPESHVLSWNKGAKELYGWSEQEAIGQVAHHLLQTHIPSSRKAPDRQLFQEGQWEGELIHTRRDGEPVIVASRQVLVRDDAGHPRAILEMNRDLTEQRRLERIEQQVQVEKEAYLRLLQRIVDELPSSVYLVRGPDARLVLANRAATAIWGASWPAEQPMQAFLSTNGLRICSEDGRLLAVEQLATLRAVRLGESVRYQQEVLRRPDGTTLPIVVQAVALDAASLLDGPTAPHHAHASSGAQEWAALVVHQDVSAFKATERLKDEFFSLAAHELRTPLAVLKGFAQTLLLQTDRGMGPPLAAWQVEALSDIDQAVSRLDRLTEDLLDVARLQAGRLVLNLRQTDLVALTRHVVMQRQLTTEQHRLCFHPSLEQVMLLLDVGRIEQVLSNLLSNAIKYSPQGGLITVRLWQEAETDEIRLSVEDHGIGIPAEEQAQIFGRFARAKNVRERGIEGTGLGLFLCRELVEWQGGQLWFASTEGVGTTFFLALPRQLHASSDQGETVGRPRRRPPTSLREESRGLA